MARQSFIDLLIIPWVDKTIAILATIPFIIELYRRWVYAAYLQEVRWRWIPWIA